MGMGVGRDQVAGERAKGSGENRCLGVGPASADGMADSLRAHDIVVPDLCEDAKSVVEEATGSDFELRTVKQGEPGGCSLEWHGENAIVTIVGTLRPNDRPTPEKWQVSLLPFGGRGANGRHSFVTMDAKIGGGSFRRLPLASGEP